MSNYLNYYIINLFNEKKIITSSNYQEFTEGLPFVVAAVVAILAVPGDTDKKKDQRDPDSRIVSVQEKAEASVTANTYVYEAIKK